MRSPESSTHTSLALRHLEALQEHYTPPGEMVPNRAVTWNHKIEYEGNSYYVHVDIDAHGEPIRLRASGPTVGVDLYETLMDGTMWLTSLLEHGVSPHEIVSMVGRRSDNSPRSILGCVADVLGEYI